MENCKFLFSVIVPVYKVEEYLRETLCSLENQTIGFENIQLIIVNDGSTDRSGEICREFQNQHNENVIYIEKENGGVSSARNAGMPFIEGKYVNFLDADDKWEKNAFKEAFEFFEEHYDEFDVLSCRVKKFEASEDWHILDFKFKKGRRIVDLSDEKKSCLVQSHTSTAIIKAEAIKENDRFAEGVKFGEDSMFINNIILRRLKLGILPEAVYYYRKRKDKSSATQLQSEEVDYYGASPKAYYSFLTKKSIELYNEVVPYIQNVLAYDIGWRVREAPSEIVLNSSELYESYCNLLKTYLGLIDEKYIIGSKVHKRIGYKTALVRLRDGTDLLSETLFNKEKEAIFYKDMSLLKLQGNHKLCFINACRIKTNHEAGKAVLIIEGLIARWVFDCCREDNVDLIIRAGKKKFRVVRKDYTDIKDKNFFSEDSRYFYFRKKIALDGLLEEKDKIRLKLCLTFSKKPYVISVNYGEKVNVSSKGKKYGAYRIVCKNNAINLSKEVKTDVS